jgi:3-dehydroshikimate dehydratase
MYIPGLLSVTFRQLTADQIIDLSAQNGLIALEWGGDVHVPHGDIAEAKRVGEASRAAGLTVAAYGSYYRCDAEADQPDFADVLASAQALGAPVIRVWAGTAGSAETSEADRARIVADLKRIGAAAAEAHITITIEFHANTLTDDPDSALALIQAIDHPNVKLYWQTSNGKSAEYSATVLERVKPYLSHLHVFHWNFGDEGIERRPLSDAVETWQRFLQIAQPAAGETRALMLEFVRDDSVEQLADDARTLIRLIESHEQQLH